MLICCLQGMEGTRRPHRWGFLLQGSGGQALRSRNFGLVQDASEDRVGEDGQEARGEGTVQNQRGDAHGISAEQRKRGGLQGLAEAGTARGEGSSHGRAARSAGK